MWGDAAVVVPWVLYERFGDLEVLARQYDSMRAWVEQIAALAGDDHVWDGPGSSSATGSIRPPLRDDPAAAPTDKTLVATAYHAHTARLLAAAAGVLGHDDDRSPLRRLARQVADGVQREFVTPTGRLASDAADGVRPGAAIRPARRRTARRRAGGSAGRAGRGRTTTASAPASSARRSCATPWSTPVCVDDAYHLLLQTAARRGCTR